MKEHRPLRLVLRHTRVISYCKIGIDICDSPPMHKGILDAPYQLEALAFPSQPRPLLAQQPIIQRNPQFLVHLFTISGRMHVKYTRS